MSIKELMIDFQSGIYLFLGANGTGKSSVFDAIVWCLYGITRSGTMDVPSHWTKKSQECEVAVVVETTGGSWSIRRRCKGSPVVVVRDMNNKDKTPADSNKFFEWFLPKSIFLSTCTNRGISFLSYTNKEKREILNVIYGLDVFDGYLKKSKEKLQECTRTKEGVDREDFKKENEINSKVEELGRLRSKVAELDSDFQDLPETRELDVVEAEYEERRLKTSKIDVEINQILALRTEPCPVCGSEPSQEDVEKKMSELPALQRKRNKFVMDSKQTGDELLAAREKGSYKTKKKQLFNLRQEVKESIEGLEEEKDELEDLLELAKHNEKVAQYWVQALGVQGIPALQLENILEVLQSVVNGFSSSNGMSMELSATQDDIEKIDCIVNGTRYQSLSKGERLRVDLALLYAFRITARATSNILILDETFDGLDQEGINFVFELLHKFCDESGSTILIASHSVSIKTERAEVYKLSKVEGVTKFELERKVKA